jgi:hypothetical protein
MASLYAASTIAHGGYKLAKNNSLLSLSLDLIKRFKVDPAAQGGHRNARIGGQQYHIHICAWNCAFFWGKKTTFRVHVCGDTSLSLVFAEFLGAMRNRSASYATSLTKNRVFFAQAFSPLWQNATKSIVFTTFGHKAHSASKRLLPPSSLGEAIGYTNFARTEYFARCKAG